MLGSPVTLDYDAARERRLEEEPTTLEAVTADLVRYFSGMFIWGHPRAQINVVPSSTIPSIIGGLLPSIYNPNLVSEESSRSVNVYISFSTMSVVSPIERLKSSVRSTIGSRISWKL